MVPTMAALTVQRMAYLTALLRAATKAPLRAAPRESMRADLLAERTAARMVKPLADHSARPSAVLLGLDSAERSAPQRVGRKVNSMAAMWGTPRAGWWASQMVGPLAMTTAARSDGRTAAQLELLRAVQMAEQ
jgi:hypothetical protein